MAVCDLTLPILRPVKATSQLGFTPGLFVKLANIMVTEKRAWAVAHDQILLIQFLDATAAFDRTLHPVILSHLFNEGIEDDQWMYFDQLHRNAATHIKWHGNISSEVIQEAIGNRQGGYSSADDWKVYGNPMIKEIEEMLLKKTLLMEQSLMYLQLPIMLPHVPLEILLEKHCIECRYSSILLKFMEYKTI